ncbi:Uncharacterised protein [Vibrio cholerae]|nr:Uncharacterised protein [Vibrio cholerae]
MGMDLREIMAEMIDLNRTATQFFCRQNRGHFICAQHIRLLCLCQAINQ